MGERLRGKGPIIYIPLTSAPMLHLHVGGAGVPLQFIMCQYIGQYCTGGGGEGVHCPLI